MEITELSERPDLLEASIKYFWSCWGNESNYIFYKNCIENSLKPVNALPKFYLALSENKIIGSYALLTNDLISRQDLMPWLACLYVNEEHRKKGVAEKLLNHGLKQSFEKGFSELFLSTGLENFYEKKDWRLFSYGYSVGGDKYKIYYKQTNNHR